MKNDEKNTVRMSMIDLHSHILPEMDDGSSSVEESVTMLCALAEQGVETVIATPHFEPWVESPELFLERRARSAEALREAMTEAIGRGIAIPRVGLGAEVAFFKGISRSSAMADLCVEGTQLLLVEMPFEKWDGQMIRELFDIRVGTGIIPVVAHLDRYFGLQSGKTISEILSSDALVQINAEALLYLGTRKKVLKMISDGDVDFIGSDCHDMNMRKPNIGEALDIIVKKFGDDCVALLEKRGRDAVGGATTLL